MFSRSAKSVALVIAGMLSLSACNPPMPPEVLATLAEQTYTCELGDTQLSAPEEIAAVAIDWQTSVAANCEGMSISPVAEPSAQVELQIGDPIDASCVAYTTVPFVADAVVFTANLVGISNVNLNATALEKIFNGEIANWNDPLLAELNSGFEMPDLQVTYGSQLSAESARPMTDWLSRLAKHDVAFATGNPAVDSLEAGALVLTTYSKATALGITMVGIVAGSNVESDLVVPDMSTISTGATQFKIKNNAGSIELTFDAKAKPIAPVGIDVAPNPYQAVSITNMRLCGVDSLKTRAAARYLLRQDSQGSLGLTTMIALPESLRVEALAAVSVGLPMPSLAPEAN